MAGYPLPVLDALPLRTVLALHAQAGRLRRDRLHDALISAGQGEMATLLREEA